MIYPVYKKGDQSDPQNYRKVSLIPSLAKVFESVLENRLSFKNLVCRDDDPLQRGFKKIVGHLMIYLCCTIWLKRKKTALRLLYRFDKSFRLFKQRCTYPETTAAQCRRLISEYNQIYVLKSSSRVKWNGKISKPIKNRYGVMQGGVLSPKLFKEFLQDLGKYLTPKDGLKMRTSYLQTT